MIISILLAKKIASLFIILLMGYALVKAGFIASENSKYISLICLYILVPCGILNAFQIDYTPNIMKGILIGVLWAFVEHFLFIFLTKVGSGPLKITAQERAAISYPNGGNLIIPLVAGVFGPEWVIYTAAFIMVQTILIWTHGVMLISGQRKIELKKILYNPNIIALAISVLMLLLRIRFPGILASAVSDTAAMMGPVSMMVIGMLIAGTDMKALLTDLHCWLIALIRLFICPCVVVLLMRLVHATQWIENGETILMISMLAAAAPTAANVTQITQTMCGHKEATHISALTVLNTLLCIASLPVMVFLFQL